MFKGLNELDCLHPLDLFEAELEFIEIEYNQAGKILISNSLVLKNADGGCNNFPTENHQGPLAESPRDVLENGGIEAFGVGPLHGRAR